MPGFLMFIAILFIVFVSKRNAFRNVLVFQGLFFGVMVVLYVTKVTATPYFPIPLVIIGIAASAIAFLPPIRQRLNF